jgi:predicted DNA-binding transcriptional regulator AlpA
VSSVSAWPLPARLFVVKTSVLRWVANRLEALHTTQEAEQDRLSGEQEEPMPGEHLNPAELAAREGVTLAAVYNWNYLGTGPPYFRTGGGAGQVRYPVAGVLEWERERMAKREREAAGRAPSP